MIVKGELEQAQLELVDADTQERKGSIKYNVTDASINIGTSPSTDAKKLFPLAVSTIAEFRSAMFPVGALQYSALSTQEFLTEMDSSWANVSDRVIFPLAQSTLDAVLVNPATDFGAILTTRGVATEQHDWGSGNIESPVYTKIDGYYLRASGELTIGVTDHTYVAETKLASQNVTHNHIDTHTETAYTNSGGSGAQAAFGGGSIDNRIGDEPKTRTYKDNAVSQTWLRGNVVYNGEDQAQPETKVMNLFIKLER